MEQERELPVTTRRNLLATGALLAGSVAGIGEANAQAPAPQAAAPPAAAQGAKPFSLPPGVWEGSVKRAQKYLRDKQAFAEYQKHLERMLEGIKAGHDPNLLIRDVVLSDEDTRAKMAPFTNVAGAEGVFHLCMLTVLATLATGRPQG
jgi:hypothetical protein